MKWKMKRFKKGDSVEFIGDTPDESDRGTVVRYHNPGYMEVAWEVAGETHDEDPADDRIQPRGAAS